MDFIFVIWNYQRRNKLINKISKLINNKNKMSLSARRYQESPKNQSAFLLSTKITASREKANANNSSVSLPKNPEL